MTPQENDALRTLLSQLIQIRGIVKDPEADAMIARAVAQQPDAAYLLVQRTLILEQALEAAKAQISRLEQQVQAAQSRAGASFLNDNAWGRTAGMGISGAPRGQTEYSVTGQPLSGAPSPYGTNPAAASLPGMGAMPASRSRMFGGGGSSMLGTLAATAAGVAGGAFLFQGIGNLLENMNHPHDAANSLADASSALQSGDLGEPESLSSDISERLDSIDNPFSDASSSDGGGQDLGGGDDSYEDV